MRRPRYKKCKTFFSFHLLSFPDKVVVTLLALTFVSVCLLPNFALLMIMSSLKNGGGSIRNEATLLLWEQLGYYFHAAGQSQFPNLNP